jgi:predicted alpha/beta-fold hydrolase
MLNAMSEPLMEMLPFEPHPLLRNGHVMTVTAVYWRRCFSLPPAEERLFRVDRQSALLAHCHWQPDERVSADQRRNLPVMAIVHGLEGSSDSNYVRGIAEKAFAQGYHVVRLNQRNCGGSERFTPTLYNSALSADYRAVVQELVAEGFTQIFLVGYSMGGNLVLKMAGEDSSDAPKALRAVCVVSPSLDPAACADALERRANFFYQRHFVSALLKRYARKAQMFPALYQRNGFPSIRTIRQFDDVITAPHFGYSDAQEYYQAAGAQRVLMQIRVPALLITAQDDPFVPYKSFTEASVDSNPAIRFLAPRHGGHCAFISRRSGAERFWAEQRIVEFCEAQRTRDSE